MLIIFFFFNFKFIFFLKIKKGEIFKNCKKKQQQLIKEKTIFKMIQFKKVLSMLLLFYQSSSVGIFLLIVYI